MWNNILYAVNNNVYIRKWLGKPWNALLPCMIQIKYQNDVKKLLARDEKQCLHSRVTRNTLYIPNLT